MANCMFKALHSVCNITKKVCSKPNNKEMFYYGDAGFISKRKNIEYKYKKYLRNTGHEDL